MPSIFKAVDEVQAVAGAGFHFKSRLLRFARSDQDAAAEFRLPTERLHHRHPAPEFAEIHQERAEEKDGVIRRHSEIVIGVRIAKRIASPADLVALRIEFVDIGHRVVGGIGDAEIEHVAAVGIELGVRREWAHVVQLAVEIVLPAGFERHRVQLVGKRLLAEGQHGTGERIHAHVDRRFQHDAAAKPIAWERGAEAAIEEAPGRLFLAKFLRPDEAIGEVRAILAET